MPKRTVQVTPQNVRDLALALVKLGSRGHVQVTTEGHVSMPVSAEGKLTACTIVRAKVIECRVGTAPIIRIPVTALGFRPTKNGDMMAAYTVGKDGVVVVRHLSKLRDKQLEGYRYFKLA